MPIYNIASQGPPGVPPSAALHQAGPILPIQVAIPLALENQLRQTGQAVPQPISGSALIDTGATFSAVDDTLFQRLGVPPIGLSPTGTAGGPAQLNVYPARFILPGSVQVGFSRVTGVHLTGQPMIALIGRDVLTSMLLVYNGPQGTVTLTF